MADAQRWRYDPESPVPRTPMTTRSLALLSLVFFAMAPTARAQDSVLTSVDPTVSAVVSGGRWTEEGRSGYYRAIIRTGSRGGLTGEWFADAARGSMPTIVHSMELKGLRDAGRLDRPQLGKYLKGWRLWIQVDSPASPGKPSTRAVDLGPPGEARVQPS